MMAHPFAEKAMTSQERAQARYSVEYGPKTTDSAQGDAAQPPEENWTGAPARQVSNLGNVRT